jgi:hypothetical protein
MTADDDRIDMTCCDCGRHFLALGDWQIRCRTCYVRFKDGLPPLATLAALQAENAQLRAELVAVRAELAQARQRKPRATPAIPRDQWRRLVQLVHPDKHGGSQAAVKAAQWLNEVRP